MASSTDFTPDMEASEVGSAPARLSNVHPHAPGDDGDQLVESTAPPAVFVLHAELSGAHLKYIAEHNLVLCSACRQVIPYESVRTHVEKKHDVRLSREAVKHLNEEGKLLHQQMKDAGLEVEEDVHTIPDSEDASGALSEAGTWPPGQIKHLDGP